MTDLTIKRGASKFTIKGASLISQGNALIVTTGTRAPIVKAEVPAVPRLRLVQRAS